MSKNNQFLNEMIKAHEVLHKELDQLEELITSSAPDSPAQLVRLLEHIQKHVTAHFAMEEKDGYMNGVLQKHPETEPHISHLLEQHRELAQSLEDILSMARSHKDSALIRTKIKDWVKSIRHHESEENLLVMDATNLDIGVAD